MTGILRATLKRRVAYARFGAILSLALAILPAMDAQSQRAESPQQHAFEVASIKPSPPDPITFGYEVSSSGRFTASAMSVKDVIAQAYGIKPWMISGGPPWVSSKLFDINAVIDPSLTGAWISLPSSEQEILTKQMMQRLLSDRFSLRLVQKNKVVPTYALVIVSSGHKLTPCSAVRSTRADGKPLSVEPTLSISNGLWMAQNVTMNFLAEQLSGQPEVGRIVSDETNLKGTYGFELHWKPSDDGTGVTIYSALQEQLGLKLVPRRAPAPSGSIEYIQQPSVN